jgi:hypothetical protein
MIAAAVAALALAAPCHTAGAAPFVLPDNVCTPGRFVRLTRQQACTSKDRPSLSAADRRRILTRYGIPAASWSGASGELDHRQPFFAGGTTDPANVWPERGPATGNPKDALENYARRRLCTGRPHPMSLRTVHIIFAGNWVAYYRFYVLGVGPRPAS